MLNDEKIVYSPPPMAGDEVARSAGYAEKRDRQAFIQSYLPALADAIIDSIVQKVTEIESSELISEEGKTDEIINFAKMRIAGVAQEAWMLFDRRELEERFADLNYAWLDDLDRYRAEGRENHLKKYFTCDDVVLFWLQTEGFAGDRYKMLAEIPDDNWAEIASAVAESITGSSNTRKFDEMRLKGFDFDEETDLDIFAQDDLIIDDENGIWLGKITGLIGESGVCKTFIAIMILKISAQAHRDGNVAMHLGERLEAGPAVLLAFEGTGDSRARIKALGGGLAIYTIKMEGRRLSEHTYPFVLSALEKIKTWSGCYPSYVAIDNYGDAILGDENKAKDAKEFLRLILKLGDRTGARFILIGHTTKSDKEKSDDYSGGFRGSDKVNNTCSTIIRVTHTKESEVVRMKLHKTRAAPMRHFYADVKINEISYIDKNGDEQWTGEAVMAQEQWLPPSSDLSAEENLRERLLNSLNSPQKASYKAAYNAFLMAIEKIENHTRTPSECPDRISISQDSWRDETIKLLMNDERVKDHASARAVWAKIAAGKNKTLNQLIHQHKIGTNNIICWFVLKLDDKNIRKDMGL